MLIMSFDCYYYYYYFLRQGFSHSPDCPGTSSVEAGPRFRHLLSLPPEHWDQRLGAPLPGKVLIMTKFKRKSKHWM